MEQTTNILDLPRELLSDICLYLESPDLIQAALSCQSFHAVLQSNFWYRYCDINVRKYQCSDFTVEFDLAEQFYKQIVYPFKDLRGQFVRLSEPYGGLLQVEWNDNKIIGYDIQAPEYPLLDGMPRRTELFRILLSEDNMVVKVCSLSCGQPVHDAVVEFVSGSHSEGDCVVRVSCTQPADHDQRQFIKESSFDQHTSSERFRTLQGAGLSFEYKQIELLSKTGLNSKMAKIVKPGLFVGDYGGHGLEIVNLAYKDHIDLEFKRGLESYPSQATLTKVTGDPNIQAGNISLQVDLTKPIRFHQWLEYIHDNTNNNLYDLELDPQGFITDYRDLWQDSEPNLPNIPTHPNFQSWLRSGVNSRYCPKTFQYAFKAKIQLRALGEAAFYEDAFWVVFNNDVHACCWIQYHHIFLFHRMTVPV